MNHYKKSIVKRSKFIFLPMFVIFAVMIASLIITFGYYKSTYDESTSCYGDISEFYAELSNFNLSVENYIYSNHSDYYLTEMDTAYALARTASINIYGNRYSYTLLVRNNAEQIYTDFQGLTTGMNQIHNSDDLDALKETYTKSIHASIINLMITTQNTLQAAQTYGDEQMAKAYTAAVVCTILVIVSFVAFVFIGIYAMYFIRKRVAEPIQEIAGWAKLFDEGYAEMDDLVHDSDDEYASLVNSFNIVKHNLEEANKLKIANETTLRKLQDEQEYKKKFVKKLYEEKKEKDTISAEAKRDGLTGLYNRRSFDAMVEEFLERKPAGATGALYLIDMDCFKNVNDTLGHIAGDEALKTLAGAMRVVFPGAYLGRYGGDEFIAFMTTGNQEIFNMKADELCRKMDRNFEYGGKSVHLSVSIGVIAAEGDLDYSELYMRVDRALYYAKEHGRNQYKNAADLDESDMEEE